MSGARITKEQRKAIKTTRRIAKTDESREGEKILKAVSRNRELTNYGR